METKRPVIFSLQTKNTLTLEQKLLSILKKPREEERDWRLKIQQKWLVYFSHSSSVKNRTQSYRRVSEGCMRDNRQAGISKEQI